MFKRESLSIAVWGLHVPAVPALQINEDPTWMKIREQPVWGHLRIFSSSGQVGRSGLLLPLGDHGELRVLDAWSQQA